MINEYDFKWGSRNPALYAEVKGSLEENLTSIMKVNSPGILESPQLVKTHRKRTSTANYEILKKMKIVLAPTKSKESLQSKISTNQFTEGTG